MSEDKFEIIKYVLTKLLENEELDDLTKANIRLYDSDSNFKNNFFYNHRVNLLNRLKDSHADKIKEYTKMYISEKNQT